MQRLTTRNSAQLWLFSGVVSAAANSSAATARPGGAPATATVALMAQGEVRVERMGNQRWLVVPAAPEKVWPQVKAGRLRALALSTAKRSAFAPEMPIIADTVPGYEAGQWWGMLAPGKTPPDVVRKLNGELNRILASEDMRPRLADQGAEPVLMTPEAFTEYVRAEITKWRRIAQDRNIKP